MKCIKRKPVLWNGLIFTWFSPFYIWTLSALTGYSDIPNFIVGWDEISFATIRQIITENWAFFSSGLVSINVFIITFLIILTLALVTSICLLKAYSFSKWPFAIVTLFALAFSTYLFWWSNQKYLVAAILFYGWMGFKMWAYISEELNSPYYVSNINWWEGRPPKNMPVSAQLKVYDKFIKGFPTNLNMRGGFFFFNRAPEKRKMNPKNVEILLKAGPIQVTCNGILMSKSRKGHGLGVCFEYTHPDNNKRLGDFFNELERYGFTKKS